MNNEDNSVVVDNTDGILTIRLNKPERLNAWNTAMRARLISLITAADGDSAVSAVILTGTGGRAFCAGQDLNEGKTFDGARSEVWIEEWRQLYNAIRRFGKPFVVALNGLAAGSAFQVALLGDIRVGHHQVRMGQPEINSGLISVTGFWIIREALGLIRAQELILTGRLMMAQECVTCGLIQELVEAEHVMLRSRELAADLASKSSLAYRLNKQRMCAVTQAGFDDAFEAARTLHKMTFDAGSPQAVMQKFLTKSKH